MSYNTNQVICIKKIIKYDGKTYSIRNDRSRIFSPYEWNKFYFSLKDYQKPIFDCLINTGARISEVLGIKKYDINFENNTITLRNIKKRTDYSDGKVRIIPISSQYSERLKKYYKSLNSERLFEITSQGVSQMLKRKLKRIGLNDYEFSLHNIRKTTECWLNFLGCNYLLILLHFGHSGSTAVQHYLKIDSFSAKYKFDARQILGDLYI
jgi:integrase